MGISWQYMSTTIQYFLKNFFGVIDIDETKYHTKFQSYTSNITWFINDLVLSQSQSSMKNKYGTTRVEIFLF